MCILTYYCGVVTVVCYILFVSVPLSVEKVTVSLCSGWAHVGLSVGRVLVGGRVVWGFMAGGVLLTRHRRFCWRICCIHHVGGYFQRILCKWSTFLWC